MTTYIGTSGGDDITGTTGDDTFRMFQGGDDFVVGDDGNDTFQFGATLTADDSVHGGTGTDTLVLNGDYSGGVTFESSTINSIETLQLRSGFSYDFTTDNGNVASGASLTVDGSAIDSGHALTFDGSAETDGTFKMIGGAGADTLTGGTNNDVFDLSRGGEDTATGGIGNDIFIMGASLDAGDNIDGGFDFGAHTNVLRLDGDYSGGVTFGATTVTNIYTFQFAAGHDYKITVDNATFASGPTVTIQGGQLGAGDALTFDGSASDANFHMTGGAGDDVLTGGTAFDIFDLSKGGNDTVNGGDLRDIFRFGETLTAGDTINGGNGTDTVDITGMGASDNITFGANTFTSVEILHLGSDNSYSLTTVDGNVAADATLLVDGSHMGVGVTLTFNGAAETDGHFIIRGGGGIDNLTGGALSDTINLTKGGNDTAHGGAGNDTINLGATLTAADTIDGGADNDTVILNGDYSGGIVLGASTLTNVENLLLTGGHNYSFAFNDANIGSGASLTVNAAAMSGHTFTLDDSAETDGGMVVTAGDAFTASDSFIGGTDGATLILNGDYSTGNAITFGATTAENLTYLLLGGDNAYNITTADSTVAAGATLTVDATEAVTGDALVFDGSAETNGSFIIISGAGEDTFTTGNGADTITGGGGEDTFFYNSVSQSVDGAVDHITDFDADSDSFQFPQIVVGTSTINNAHVDNYGASLGVAIDDQLTVNGAIVVNVTTGTLAGHAILVVDVDHNTFYTPGTDYVIDITGATNMGDFSVANFLLAGGPPAAPPPDHWM